MTYKRKKYLYSRRFGGNLTKIKENNRKGKIKMSVYQEISQRIKEADGVLIGASNGLSIAEGYHLFADDEWFRENMRDFREKYGIRCILQGMTIPFSSERERWAYYSRVIKAKSLQHEPTQIMKDMYELVKEKDYFVVTSNAEDHFVPAGFAEERVFEMEGKLTEMRCASGCCAELYSDKEVVLQMTDAEVDGSVPSDLCHKCPKCGGSMIVNYGEASSFQGEKSWQEKADRYQAFIDQMHGKKLVILEFGIGWRNQMIKAPFMRLTAAEPYTSYIIFNKGEIYIPDEIQKKSIGVDQDIASVLRKIVKEV